VKPLTRGVRITLWTIGTVAAVLLVQTHLSYFRNPTYLGGLIAVEIVLACLWHFEAIFFPLVMFAFFWAGMSVPLTSIAVSGRWFVLGVAAVAGFVIWMRQRNQSYDSFHLIALFSVITAIISAIVSAEPMTAVLKASSLLLLFLYGATGARLAIQGREVKFMKGMVLACEIGVFLLAAAQWGARWAILGNPNSLGAIVGVVVTPFVLWGFLIAETRLQRILALAALLSAGLLLYVSLCRAGTLAAGVSVLAICFALRRQRLLVQGAFVAVLFFAVTAILDPSGLEQFVKTISSNVVYKGGQQGGVFLSRKTPWEETSAVVKKHPWFGSGFGTSDMGQSVTPSKFTLDPSAGGLYTREGTNREHGSSYLALLEYVGVFGVLFFGFLIFLVLRMIFRVCVWMRRTSNPYHCAIPVAMFLLAGLVHAFFEDWLLATGYYLCVLFWVQAFWLRDLMPAPLPAVVRVTSSVPPGVPLILPET
jgi:O-antigen ligase